jgi:hypothetical protein
VGECVHEISRLRAPVRIGGQRASSPEEIEMNRKFLLAGAAMLLTSGAFGGADDYAFEPVRPEIKATNEATIAVRLVHKPNGKPVAGAAIVQTRLDMTPDGMADMATVIVPLPSPEPGVYAFKAPLTMTGRWLLSISAKVPGEPEPVVGKITFRVTR